MEIGAECLIGLFTQEPNGLSCVCLEGLFFSGLITQTLSSLPVYPECMLRAVTVWKAPSLSSLGVEDTLRASTDGQGSLQSQEASQHHLAFA